jgi:formylglycine-generating enzyme required for sulfatase activity
MAGNVWEWTRSAFRSYPYIAGDGRERPHTDVQRVLRGGSFDRGQDRLRVASCGRLYPDYSPGGVGFRVVSSSLRS